MQKLYLHGIGSFLEAIADECPERFWGEQQIFAGGMVAEAILAWHHEIRAQAPNDIDIFIPTNPHGSRLALSQWADKLCPLFYIGKREGRAQRKIPFLWSARDGKANYIEMDTDHIDISDLLDSFDLNVCQAAWQIDDWDTVHVSDAFVRAMEDHKILLNPLVAMDERIAGRIVKKAERYGWQQ